MRKVLAITAIALFAFSFASCKKSYDCVCTDLFTGATSEKSNKGKNAADACNDAETKVLTIPMDDCVPK